MTAGERPLPAAVVWGPALGDHIEASSLVQGAQGLLFQNGSAVRLTAGDVGEVPTYEGNFRYAGVDDNYFMTVALEPGPEQGDLSARDDSRRRPDVGRTRPAVLHD